MFVLLETLLIVLYMVNSKIAFLFSILLFGGIIVFSKKEIYYKLYHCMIMSMPLFTLSILGKSFHHFLSWINIFMFIYLFMLFHDLIKRKYSFSKSVLWVFVFLCVLLVQNLLFDNIIGNIIEYIQLLIMILPIILTYYAKDYLKIKIGKVSFDHLKKLFLDVIVATALSVIIQYFLYINLGISIGKVSLQSSRIIFDAVFAGFSILSIFLGLGLVCFAINYIEKSNKLDLVKLFIIILAILYNSSRSGLFGAGLSIALYLLFRIVKNKKINLKKALLLLLFAVLMIIALLYMNYNRGENTFLSDSGRSSTYLNALNLIMEDFKIFFIGNGLSSENYDFMLPHNMLLQTWMTCGIINLVIFIVLILKQLKTTKDSSFLYMEISVILGGMLTTDFYANAFYTIVVILGYLNFENKNEKLIEGGKE